MNYPNKKPLPEGGRGFCSQAKRTLLISQAYACWIWHSSPYRSPLPKLHRASPSASLDKNYNYFYGITQVYWCKLAPFPPWCLMLVKTNITDKIKNPLLESEEGMIM
jgi:hypothetical protein